MTLQKVIVTDDNGIRLNTDGTSSIENIEINPQNATTSDIEMQGNFNQASLTLMSGTKLTANEGFAVEEIIVDVADKESEVQLVSGTGDFSDANQIIVKKASTINAVGETNIQQIHIAAENSDQSIALEGNMQEAEVIVSQPASLFIGASINKINALADVNIDGEPEKIESIQSFEKLESVNVTPANSIMEELFTVIKRQMIMDAIEEIQKLPSQVSIKDIHTIQSASRLVNNALSFGAVPTDFVVEEVDYYDKLNKTMDSKSKVMNALVDLKKQLQGLTAQPENIQAIGLDGLQVQIDAVQNSITNAEGVGVLQSDIAKVDHYQRFAPAKDRAAVLKKERTDALEKATIAIDALPVAEDISFENFLDIKQKLLNAKAAVAEAQQKGVKFETLATLENAEIKVNELEKEKQASILAANQKLANLLIGDRINYQNIEDVRQISNRHN